MRAKICRVFVALSLFGLLGCSASPEYVRPAMPKPLPTSYKSEGNWKKARPADALERDSWWLRFNDADLNELMTQALQANQEIAIAAANFRQARTQIAGSRAGFFPKADAQATGLRSGRSDAPAHTSRYTAGLDASWELTFWNNLPAFEMAKMQTEASAADYATMRLAIQAELAQTYFQLRLVDVQLALFTETIEAYTKAHELTKNQYAGGVVTFADVAQAETQLASAKAEHTALQRERAEAENAIAVLVGQIPSSFALKEAPLTAHLASVPHMVPSLLLERRPDVAAAERNVMSANEQIGVARVAWFPSISLGGSTGLESAAWRASPLEVWSFGPSILLSLFDSGKRMAEIDAAYAGYESAVASYRQTVLVAFQEVENNLSGLQYMEEESNLRDSAVKASEEALRLSLAQYEAGTVDYLQVVSSQTTTLANQRQHIQIEGQRLIATVSLIKALGGGWDSSLIAPMRTGESIPQEGRLE